MSKTNSRPNPRPSKPAQPTKPSTPARENNKSVPRPASEGTGPRKPK